tara:strand:- start:522 stop:1010 length:489 start_codon:yes stop_codon:yes gene_type:complete
MILQYFFKKENKQKIIANNIYKNILVQSNIFIKENNFFKHKNYATSFEIVSFILIIYININIARKIKNFKIINEELINLFILDLDESLRSKGIGDMSIGKYVKTYVKKFYFRLSKFPRDISDSNSNTFNKYLSYLEYIEEKNKSKTSEIFFKLYKQISSNYK